MASFRRRLRAVYLAALRLNAALSPRVPWCERLVVFAPHPDDETLACGGRIAQAVASGTAVTIVVMTDGALGGGPDGIPHDVAALRKSEVAAAAQALGVRSEDVVLLDYPDAHLGEHTASATRRVAQLLEQTRPVQVYLPYRRDAHPDHIATWTVVTDALAHGNGDVTTFEYPVWMLHHWPLVRAGNLAPSSTSSDDRGAKASRFALARRLGRSAKRVMLLLVLFRRVCALDHILFEKKAEAIRAHTSQTSRSPLGSRNVTIADISDGEFIELFSVSYERFRTHRIRDSPRPSPPV